jgi:hypothetical protein
MKTYKIKAQKIVEQTYIINAETEDQAKQIIESGEINTLNDNYDDDDYEENDDYENECVNGSEYIEFRSVIRIK